MTTRAHTGFAGLVRVPDGRWPRPRGWAHPEPQAQLTVVRVAPTGGAPTPQPPSRVL